MAEFQHIDVRRSGVTAVVRFRDQRILNDMVIETVGRELRQLADSDDCGQLLLDFTGVEFLSSSILGKLITVNKKMKVKGGQLKLCSVAKDVREIFTLTSLDRIFDIVEDEAAGFLAFYK